MNTKPQTISDRSVRTIGSFKVKLNKKNFQLDKILMKKTIIQYHLSQENNLKTI
jgi:hypothetical protein